MNQEQVRAAAENPWTVMLSRVSNILAMPLIPLAFWIATQFISNQIAPMKAAVDDLTRKVDAIQGDFGKVSLRVDNLEEARQLKDLIDQRQDIYIEENKKSFDKIQDSLDKLATAVTESANRRSSIDDIPPWTGPLQR